MDKITVFTSPKPFTDPHIDLIQRNAICSWLQFGEDVDVLLIGDEEGCSGVAEEFQVTHIPDVEHNEWGTPRVDSIFDRARESTSNRLLAYLNADIILPPDFVEVIREIARKMDQFLVVGRRWDLPVNEEIHFNDGWVEWLDQQRRSRGKLCGPTAMDYFVFPREIFTDAPPFAIGRAGWDNWMVNHAQQQGWMVLDVTPSLTVIHQEHDYAHLPGGKPHYKLEESRRNVRLGGGFTEMYDLLDVRRQYKGGRIRHSPLTLPRLLRKLERWVMPEGKGGWRWRLTRQIRQLRKLVTYRA